MAQRTFIKHKLIIFIKIRRNLKAINFISTGDFWIDKYNFTEKCVHYTIKLENHYCSQLEISTTLIIHVCCTNIYNFLYSPAGKNIPVSSNKPFVTRLFVIKNNILKHRYKSRPERVYLVFFFYKRFLNSFMGFFL